MESSCSSNESSFSSSCSEFEIARYLENVTLSDEEATEFRRTSTPIPGTFAVPGNPAEQAKQKDSFQRKYAIWKNNLHQPPTDQRVRGVRLDSKDIISGHIPEPQSQSDESFLKEVFGISDPEMGGNALYCAARCVWGQPWEIPLEQIIEYESRAVTEGRIFPLRL